MYTKFYLVKNFRKYKRAYISKNTGTLYYIIGTPKEEKYRFKWQIWSLYKKNKKLGEFLHLMEAYLHANKDQEAK
jgi:hypothetical protein